MSVINVFIGLYFVLLQIKTMSSIGAVIYIILIHLTCLFLIQTSFVPDEYWQSLEVAHNIVFHYGNITWEWQEGLRSYIYPSIIALVYYTLALLHLDSVENLVLAPRFLQACISMISDTYIFHWVSRDIPGAGSIALFCISTAWFWLYCSSRTLINTMETSLTAIALYYYPWKGDKTGSSLFFLYMVGFACIIRPTAVIPWIPLCFHHITSSANKIHVLKEYVLLGLLHILILVLADSYFYSYFVITPINFLFVNVLKNVADFYGTHSIHWYISTGLPTVFGLHLLTFIMGSIKTFSSCILPTKTIHLLFTSVVFTIGIYSLLPHKEFRFILPLMPMVLFISSSSFSGIHKTVNRYTTTVLYVVFILSSIIPTVYLGIFHQRGTLDVMRDLAHEASSDSENTNLLFLMPCHSSPLYSHLHVNVSTRYLTCDPRDVFHSNSLYDEADEFYRSPITWLNKNLNSLPSHVIMFDVLYPQVAEYFSSKHYNVFSCYHHTHLTEGRVGQSVYVLKYQQHT